MRVSLNKLLIRGQAHGAVSCHVMVGHSLQKLLAFQQFRVPGSAYYSVASIIRSHEKQEILNKKLYNDFLLKGDSQRHLCSGHWHSCNADPQSKLPI